MSGQDDIQTTNLAILGFVSALVIFIIIVGLQVLYYQVASRQRAEKDTDLPSAELSLVLAAQQAKLTARPMRDPESRTIHIPIDLAMELVVRDGGAPVVPSVQPVATPPAPVSSTPSPTPPGGKPEGGPSNASPKP